ncbi:hypothetical protein VC83_00374 [Pseudogymnoascus destructans]|nr:uncharacterized protein VC83_00374 [Pseudogymnoascus destructans]OAF63208.2 hypothetical protein VC83_00374 [Pseudogymnoascus destructans]
MYPGGVGLIINGDVYALRYCAITMAAESTSLEAAIQDISLDGIQETSFPTHSKTAAGLVGGAETDISSLAFSDKILITISQGGRLSQWIQVPLSTASPTAFDTALPAGGDDSLPAPHINPKILLGAGGEARETLGHLIASQIASLVLKREPEEARTILVGVGLLKVDLDRSAWFDLLELLAKVV